SDPHSRGTSFGSSCDLSRIRPPEGGRHEDRSMRFAVSASILGWTLVACSTSPTSPSATSPQAVGTPLSLLAADWGTISTPDAFPLTNDAGGGLAFEFPASDGQINYLYNVRPPQTLSGTLSVSLQVTTSQPVVFALVPEPSNTCSAPPSVGPFF